MLKTTTLNLAANSTLGRVQFAQGADVKPTHDGAWWAEQTRGFDSNEDRVPAAAFNRAIWRGMMGDKPYPEIRSGIVMRHRAATAPVAETAVLPR